jgi:hypothetical protein
MKTMPKSSEKPENVPFAPENVPIIEETSAAKRVKARRDFQKYLQDQAIPEQKIPREIFDEAKGIIEGARDRSIVRANLKRMEDSRKEAEKIAKQGVQPGDLKEPT